MEFGPPPPREPQPEWRLPPWFGPPENTIGALLPIRRALARFEKAVVYLLGLTAFPSGCDIDLTMRTRGLEQRHPPWLDPFMFDPPRRARRLAPGRETGVRPGV